MDHKFFLVFSEWWGFSNAGSKKISIMDNGSYILYKQFRVPEAMETRSIEKVGKIDSDQILKLKSFLKENVTENSSAMIFDAGYDIEYFDGEKEINIKNNQIIWKQIKEFIPEYDQTL